MTKMNVWKLEPGQSQELPPIELRYDGKKVTKCVIIHNTKKISQHLVVEDAVGTYHIFLAVGGLADGVSPLEEKEGFASDRV